MSVEHSFSWNETAWFRYLYMFICRSASEYQVQYSVHQQTRSRCRRAGVPGLHCLASLFNCAIGAIGARASWFNGCITLLPLLQEDSSTTWLHYAVTIASTTGHLRYYRLVARTRWTRAGVQASPSLIRLPHSLHRPPTPPYSPLLLRCPCSPCS